MPLKSKLIKVLLRNNFFLLIFLAIVNEDPKGMNMNMMPSDLAKQGLGNPGDMDLIGRGFMDSLFMKNGKGGDLLGSFGLEDPNFLETHSTLYNKMKEKNRYERSLKIERYKNKKRNWAKKIAYDCRKRVADTRLRIKGRFISKKVKINILIDRLIV